MARVLRHRRRGGDKPGRARSFRNFGKYVIDFIHFLDSTPEEVRRRIVFDDFERINAVMAEKKGIIFVTLHYGNWDMGAAGLAAYGYPVNVVAETFPLRAMNDLVQGSRRHLGMKVTPMEQVGPSIIRALRRGEILALLIDVPEPGGTVRVDFFGVAHRGARRARPHRPPQRRPRHARRRHAGKGEGGDDTSGRWTST